MKNSNKSHSRRPKGEITLKTRLIALLEREKSMTCRQAAKMLLTTDTHVRATIQRSRADGEKIFRVVEWGFLPDTVRLTAFYGIGSAPDADRSVRRPGKGLQAQRRLIARALRQPHVVPTGRATWLSGLGA